MLCFQLGDGFLVGVFFFFNFYFDLLLKWCWYLVACFILLAKTMSSQYFLLKYRKC